MNLAIRKTSPRSGTRPRIRGGWFGLLPCRGGWFGLLPRRGRWLGLLLLVLVLAGVQLLTLPWGRGPTQAVATSSLSLPVAAEGPTRFEQDDGRLLYKGKWTAVNSALASAGGYCQALSPEAAVAVPFYGTRLDLLSSKGPGAGLAEVRVDGGPPVLLDLSAPAWVHQQRVFSTGRLPLGLHVVDFAQSPHSSADHGISIDAVEVEGLPGYISGGLAATSRREDKDLRIEYQPAWLEHSGTAFSGRSFQHSPVPGASARLEFWGVHISVIAATGPSYGRMQVILDGIQVATVDLCSPRPRYGQRVWTSGGLLPGNHSVQLVAADPGPSATKVGAINLDAVEVVGELWDPSLPSAEVFDQQKAAVHLFHLADDLGARLAGSPREQEAADYAAAYLAGLGYHPRTDEVPLPNGRVSRNVVAVKPGASSLTIVIGAHLDSKPPSPGGNDNASGVATVLEIARCVHEVRLVPTTVFVLFGAEEMIDSNRDHHHYGSRAYASGLSAQGWADLVGMISLDMVGFGDRFHVRTMGRGPNVLSDLLLKAAKQRGLSLTYLRDPSPYGYSDHEPFELRGIPAAWLQWREDPQYHTAGDTAAHCNLSRVKQTGDLVTAFLSALTESDLSSLQAAAR